MPKRTQLKEKKWKMELKKNYLELLLNSTQQVNFKIFSSYYLPSLSLKLIHMWIVFRRPN